MTPRWTRALPIAAVVFGLFAVQLVAQCAHGQTLLNWHCGELGSPFGCGGAPAHAPTGDKDLDRAVAICDAHPNMDTMVVPVLPPYAKNYPECDIVLQRWEQSDTGRQIAEHKAKELADKAWLEDYVRGLKP